MNNPEYIKPDDMSRDEDIKHIEPRLAFYGLRYHDMRSGAFWGDDL